MRMERFSLGRGAPPYDASLLRQPAIRLQHPKRRRFGQGSTETHHRVRRFTRALRTNRPPNRGAQHRMQDLCRYADRPLAFVARYVRVRAIPHAAILLAVLAAVACSVAGQYGIKLLVDILSGGLSGANAARAWFGLMLVVWMIAELNVLSRS